MSDWSDAGLPLPQLEEYQEESVPGIIRTPFRTAHPSQTIRERRISFYTLIFLLDQSLVKTARNFIESQGYEVFTIDLVNGQIEARVISDYAIKAIGPDAYALSMTVCPPNPITDFLVFRVTQHSITEILRLITNFHVTQHNVAETLKIANPTFQVTQHNVAEILDASGDYP